MDYPLHLGVTEAGDGQYARVKSTAGIATLLSEGIGDTIRVSLSAPPVEEVKVGAAILESLGLRERGLGHKRALALREYALGVEALERFTRGEPLYRVHECVFGVLALESEPVDPRL